MNENAKKWVEALRSGEFKQTQSCLVDEKGYCCLGVGAVVYQRHTGAYIDMHDRLDLSGGRTPVREWLGLSTGVGDFERSAAPSGVDGYYAPDLTLLNDSFEWSFEQIADFIEPEPEGLFKEG